MSCLKENFYVISVYTNPERFATRKRLFLQFIDRMKRYNVNFYIAEAAFGDRDFDVTEEGNPNHIRLRTNSEIWHKENLINVAISRLPHDWKYVAWIDGDIDFVRQDWVEETINELQHHSFVQLFEDAIDLGPEHQILIVHKGFGYSFKKDLTVNGKKGYHSLKNKGVNTWHPGYAWAATREAINTTGGLFDFAILGAGDHHMAKCLIGRGADSIPEGLNENYKKLILAWQERALRLYKNIGYVKGSIYHYWHGKKKDRRYHDRWKILVDNNFDPTIDIHKDFQGLWTLYPGHDKLRDQIRDYFQCRNEDSVDL